MTHRFLGDAATDRMRNEYLNNEVNKHEDRSAQVVCNLVYYDGEQEIIGEGILNGFISKECRWNNGFGFDEAPILNNAVPCTAFNEGFTEFFASLYANNVCKTMSDYYLNMFFVLQVMSLVRINTIGKKYFETNIKKRTLKKSK